MDMKSIRKRAGMTQAALAKASGVSLMSIVRYENGLRTPPPETAKKIASVLGFPWTKFYE